MRYYRRLAGRLSSRPLVPVLLLVLLGALLLAPVILYRGSNGICRQVRAVFLLRRQTTRRFGHRLVHQPDDLLQTSP